MLQYSYMAVLRVDHPDIENFILSMENKWERTNFTRFAGITDTFMRAVEADQPFDLISPQSGDIVETLPARTLFDLIVEQGFSTSEPGLLFYTR